MLTLRLRLARTVVDIVVNPVAVPVGVGYSETQRCWHPQQAQLRHDLPVPGTQPLIHAEKTMVFFCCGGFCSAILLLVIENVISVETLALTTVLQRYS